MTEEIGREETPQVRPYDFRSPERLTSSTRRSLEPNQGQLAESLSDALSEALAMPCHVRFEKLSEESSEDFLSNGKLATYQLKPVAQRGNVYFQVESPLAQALIDRLMGGPCMPREVDRAPTEIETALLTPLADEVSSSTAQSWNGEGTSIGESTFLTRNLSREIETITGVISSFAVRFGDDALAAAEAEAKKPEDEVPEEAVPEEEEKSADEEKEEGAGEENQEKDAETDTEEAPEDDPTITGRLRLFFNFDELADILGFGKSGTGPAEGDEHLTTDHLAQVTIPLSASYRPTPVAIRDITTLQVGDVLFLDHKPTDEVEIRMGNVISFYGHPGAIEKSIGVRISRSRKV